MAVTQQRHRRRKGERERD